MTVFKNIYEMSLFNFSIFSLTAELFLGYSLLQLSLYAIVLRNLKFFNFFKKKIKFTDFYSFGVFTFVLTFILVYNETIVYETVGLNTYNSSITNDYMSFVMKEIICATAVVFFCSLKFSRSTVSLSNSFEYYTFLSTAVLGSVLMCSSNDFIFAYLVIELQSIAFYAMACSKKNSSYAVESGLKYFIIGSFSSSFFLLGSSFIYLSCGTLNFQELQSLLPVLFYHGNFPLELLDLYLNIVYIGFFLISSSIFVKLAVAPFHLWSIDVYESAPTATTYFFSVIPKLGLFVFLAKIFYFTGVFSYVPELSSYYLLFSILSICVGSVGGLEQRKLKSLLAYSSVSHTGYALMSFGIGTDAGFVFTFYYLIFYMLSGLCFWSIIMFLKKKTETRFIGKFNKEIGDFTMLRLSNPALAIIASVTLFSLAGIPPIIGFLIKFGAFLVTVQTSTYLLSVIGITLTVISTFYYLRLIKTIFFESAIVGNLYYPIDSNKSSFIVLIFFSLILFFLKPSFFYMLILKICLLMF